MTSAEALVAEVPNEVIGWRLFALDGGRLVSPFQRDKWRNVSPRMHWSAGVNRAECLARPGCVSPGKGCKPDEWPPVVDLDPLGPRREVSVEGFREALRGLTFGKAFELGPIIDMGPRSDAFIGTPVKIGLDAAESMVQEVGTRDLARALFDSELKPTIPEAEAFIEAVVEHLYPYGPARVKRTQIFTTPPPMGQVFQRDLDLNISRSLGRLG